MKQRTTMATALLAGLAVVLSGAVVAEAQTAAPALNTRYGDPAATLSAEIDGMGWTGVALYRGGFSNVLNPACLTGSGPLRTDASVQLSQVHEDRFQPLYDSFSSYVYDVGIASSRNHFFGTGFAVAGRVPVGWRPLSLGLSLTERYTFGYGFSEQILDPNPSASQRDAALEDRAADLEGSLHALSGGAAVALTPRISLGVAAHYGFGTRDEALKRRFYKTASSSLYQDSSYDMEGLNYTLGLLVHAGERLDFGLAYESPMAVTGDTQIKTTHGTAPDSIQTVDGTAGVNYPRIYRAGFAYRPRSSPRTVFTVDAAFSKWTEVDDSRLIGNNPLILQDTWDVRIGLEHTFYNALPVRFGFRRLDSYEDREAGTTFFTAGIGVKAGGGLVNVSTELAKATSIRPHWFPYPTGTSGTVPIVAGDLARVETTSFRVGLGFTREF